MDNVEHNLQFCRYKVTFVLKKVVYQLVNPWSNNHHDNQHLCHFSELNATDNLLFGAEKCINVYIWDQMSTKIVSNKHWEKQPS